MILHQPHSASLGCMVQDFFDLEAIPSDTDYRMYSYKHGYGNLPGVDIATILDAEAYHTDRDASNRIRNGTLQVGIIPPSSVHGMHHSQECALSTGVHHCFLSAVRSFAGANM